MFQKVVFLWAKLLRKDRSLVQFSLISRFNSNISLRVPKFGELSLIGIDAFRKTAGKPFILRKKEKCQES